VGSGCPGCSPVRRMRLGVLLGPTDWPGAGEGAGGPGNVFWDIPTILDTPKLASWRDWVWTHPNLLDTPKLASWRDWVWTHPNLLDTPKLASWRDWVWTHPNLLDTPKLASWRDWVWTHPNLEKARGEQLTIAREYEQNARECASRKARKPFKV
jgi:hypothetical protein